MAGSLLEGLQAERDGLVEKLTNLIPVPVWGTKGSKSLVLRVKPVERNVITRASAGMEKAGRRTKAEAAEEADAIVVSAAVDKVIYDGDVEVTLKELAPYLNLPEDAAGSDVVRAFCLRPGDVTALAQKVAELSGYGEQIDVIDEEFSGE